MEGQCACSQNEWPATPSLIFIEIFFGQTNEENGKDSEISKRTLIGICGVCVCVCMCVLGVG